jgi:hypothetical protein
VIVLGWLWYIVVQLIMAFFMVLGWLLLIPFCLAHAWEAPSRHRVSIKDNRPIDIWRWRPLNKVYGNPEDGVSGQQAIVWDPAGTAQVPYMPLPAFALRLWTLAPLNWQARIFVWLLDAWRAYCWSAWRNSSDGLKYLFAWSRGPQATIRGYKIGWWEENGKKVPLL